MRITTSVHIRREMAHPVFAFIRRSFQLFALYEAHLISCKVLSVVRFTHCYGIRGALPAVVVTLCDDVICVFRSLSLKEVAGWVLTTTTGYGWTINQVKAHAHIVPEGVS